jgi:hypothetical protein
VVLFSLSFSFINFFEISGLLIILVFFGSSICLSSGIAATAVSGIIFSFVLISLKFFAFTVVCFLFVLISSFLSV